MEIWHVCCFWRKKENKATLAKNSNIFARAQKTSEILTFATRIQQWKSGMFLFSEKTELGITPLWLKKC